MITVILAALLFVVIVPAWILYCDYKAREARLRNDSGIKFRRNDSGIKFRKKPVVIEAFQMTAERRLDNSDWPIWMHKAWQRERETLGSLYPTEKGTGDGTLSIGTLGDGQNVVSFGDWIIQGVNDELYPCKPDIFEATYEEV